MPQKLAVYKYRSQNIITYTFQLQIWYTCGMAANTRGAESYNAARRNQILIDQKNSWLFHGNKETDAAVTMRHSVITYIPSLQTQISRCSLKFRTITSHDHRVQEQN